MSGRVTGKVALISGGARGQGAAVGRLLAREGAEVVLGDVRESEGQEVVHEIAAAGGSAMYVHLDVRKETDWQSAVEATVSRFGKVNVLYNNAGILSLDGVLETSLEAWNEIVSVNQTGVFPGLKHTIPAMIKAGSGSIINVSSILGLVGFGGGSAYQSTKGAIRILTKQTAVQFASQNIRINSIHPGMISTPFLDTVAPEVLQAVRQMTPMGREGTAEEVANCALFLASDESSFVTGAELVVDGGYTTQ